MITKEQKLEYAKRLLHGAAQYLIEKNAASSVDELSEQFLSELKATGIYKQLATQRVTDFKSHRKHVDDLVMKGISPEFVDFSNGIAEFKIKSSEEDNDLNNPGEYQMAIRFYEWNKFFDDPMLPMFRRIDRLIKGNIGLACACPSFHYHFGYQTYLKGSDIYDDEHRYLSITDPALITNPKNIGIGCKHIARLMNPYNYRLYVAPMVMKAIAEKLPNNGKSDKPNVPSAPNSKQNVYPSYKLPREMKPQ